MSSIVGKRFLESAAEVAESAAAGLASNSEVQALMEGGEEGVGRWDAWAGWWEPWLWSVV